MRRKKNLLFASLLFFGFGQVSQATADDRWRFDNAERIVAFSDVHGDYDAMHATLAGAGLIDAASNWTGSESHLVIVGDILDRGPGSRAAMDLLMRLEDEAAAAGGMVHVLIGNHEVMNIVGDTRYVHPGEYAAFAADESAADRDLWFRSWLNMRQHTDLSDAEARDLFDRAFPAGYFAHREAFAADGKYGAWLLQKPMLVVIDGNAFVHGGLAPVVAESGLQGVNGDLMDDVRTYARQLQLLTDERVLLPTDPNSQHVEIVARVGASDIGPAAVQQAVADIRRLDSELFSYQSPHWYRGHTYCSELIEGDRIAAALEKIGAVRVIVGHTPTPTREIVQRLDGRVIEIDTGMNSSYYKGSGHALVIENDTITVLNEDGSAGLPPAEAARSVGARPVAGLTAADIEYLLENGEIAGGQVGKGLTVTLDGSTVAARFIRPVRGGIHPEVAAYRVDRLLGLDMVPVTVLREHDGKRGALQFAPVRSMDENQRQAQQTGGGAWCPLPLQWDSMVLLDALVGNDARSVESIFYNLDNWQLMLVGFDRAFSTSTALPTRIENGELAVGGSWQSALRGLGDEQLSAALGDVLGKRRIRALAERRDRLLNR